MGHPDRNTSAMIRARAVPAVSATASTTAALGDPESIDVVGIVQSGMRSGCGIIQVAEPQRAKGADRVVRRYRPC